jgi:hypothetical protein
MDMKNPLLPALFVILICSGNGVLADPRHGYSRNGSEARITTYERRGGYEGGGYHHHRGGWGWSPLAAAAVIGSSVYIANSLATPPVTTVYVSPPVVQYSPPRVAYFCSASQQYYPVVSTCPMPWQLVSY